MQLLKGISALLFVVEASINWQRLPGSTWKQISVSDDEQLVIGVNNNDEVITFNPATGALRQVPDTTLSMVAACNNGVAWGLQKDGSIFRSIGPVWGSFKWQRVSGTLSTIECGSGEYEVWGTHPGGGLFFFYNNDWRRWNQLKQVSVSRNQLWGVDTAGRVMRSELPSASGQLVSHPGQFTQISVGSGGVYALHSSKEIYRRLGSNEWVKETGADLISISVGKTSIYGVTQEGGYLFKANTLPLAPQDDECLKIHSDARTKVGLNAVTWDPVLAQSALDYATYLQNTSKWEHSQQPVGENLYMGPGPCADAARMWYAERVNYNGEKIGEGNFMSYGHFTQMLYPGLTAIGCGTTKRYVVCHYSSQQFSGVALTKW